MAVLSSALDIDAVRVATKFELVKLLRHVYNDEQIEIVNSTIEKTLVRVSPTIANRVGAVAVYGEDATAKLYIGVLRCEQETFESVAAPEQSQLICIHHANEQISAILNDHWDDSIEVPIDELDYESENTNLLVDTKQQQQLLLGGRKCLSWRFLLCALGVCVFFAFVGFILTT